MAKDTNKYTAIGRRKSRGKAHALCQMLFDLHRDMFAHNWQVANKIKKSLKN